MGLSSAGPQAIGVCQTLILAAQLKLLTWPRVDRVDLLQAGPEHIHLSRPVARETTQVAQLGTDLVEVVIQGGIAAKRLGHRLTGETVQYDAMLLRLTQPPLIGLTVDGHQQLAKLPQHTDRNGPSADMSLGTTPCRHGSDKDQTVLYIAAGLDDPQGREVFRPDLDHSFDDSGLGTRPHQGRVGPSSEQQPEAGDDHGLACTRLTGDHVQAGRQLQHRIIDDAEVLNPDLAKHGDSLRTDGVKPAQTCRNHHGYAGQPHATRSQTGQTSPPAGRRRARRSDAVSYTHLRA